MQRAINTDRFTTRLALTWMLLAGALALMVVYAVTRLESVSGTLSEVGRRQLPMSAVGHDIELNVTRISLQMRHAMLVQTPSDLEAALSDIEQKKALVNNGLATLRSRTRLAEQQRELAKLDHLAASFQAIEAQVVPLLRSGQRELAFRRLVDDVIPVRNELLQSIDRFNQAEEAAIEQAILTEGTLINQTHWKLMGLSAAVVLMMGGVFWLLMRGLRQRVEGATAVADRIAHGDLTHRVSDERRDEFLPLMRALEGMRSGLIDIAQTVRFSSEEIATGVSEIANGNADLSRRTENQASSLQQTAASMEELTATVEQSATTADQATQLAAVARQAAESGGQLVEQVVRSMEGISDSAKKIETIISVIDGIAFQTNILALNAAVEAARAGEHGRGFAVVASEVRSLAGRSAEAAREIKQLIGASMDTVQAGAELVHRTGSAMQDIVAHAREVSVLIQTISDAASQQTTGISQIGAAVGQLDEVTQQNAALVEQASAASESLKSQADRLMQAVSQLKV